MNKAPDLSKGLLPFIVHGEPKKKHTSTLKIFRTDALVVRSYKPSCVPHARGEIGGVPSKKSLQNLVFLLNNSDVPFSSMLTLTMTPDVERNSTIEDHKNMLKACIQRLRRDGVGQYCWVREFTKIGTVHWHVFTDKNVGEAGAVNSVESKRWSKWLVKYYKRLQPNSDFKFMENGDGRSFIGCCRFEQLRTDAGGRYAGKEGAKRFQKKAPERWVRGGAWWRASRGVKCTPLKTIEVDAETIETVSVKINGKACDVACRIQFNRGLKER